MSINNLSFEILSQWNDFFVQGVLTHKDLQELDIYTSILKNTCSFNLQPILLNFNKLMDFLDEDSVNITYLGPILEEVALNQPLFFDNDTYLTIFEFLEIDGHASNQIVWNIYNILTKNEVFLKKLQPILTRIEENPSVYVNLNCRVSVYKFIVKICRYSSVQVERGMKLLIDMAKVKASSGSSLQSILLQLLNLIVLSKEPLSDSIFEPYLKQFKQWKTELEDLESLKLIEDLINWKKKVNQSSKAILVKFNYFKFIFV